MQYPLLGYVRHRCLVLPAEAEAANALPEVERHKYVCREVQLADLAPLLARPESQLRARDLARARAEGHVCIGVYSDDELVSFSLNSLQPINVVGPYRLRFPDGWVYHYMAVTLPDWRGRRLHSLQMAAVRQRFAGPRFKGIVTSVISVNYSSLASFRRMGFRHLRSFFILGDGRNPRLAAPLSGRDFAFVKAGGA
jgi:hypothetical protein